MSLTVDCVHNVLPGLWPPDFDKYMLGRGIEEWKVAFNTLPANTAKSLLLMVMSRPKLAPFFECLLSDYNTEETFLAVRLYEIGLARCLRQNLLARTEEVSYYKTMNPNYYPKCFPLLPELKHEHNYFSVSYTWMTPSYDKIVPTQAYSVKAKTPENVYMAKLFSASAAARHFQWPECWAHSLSALDFVPPSEVTNKKHLHDLFCLIGQSAGHMYGSLRVVLKAISYGRMFTTNLEHPWKRLLMLHDLLIHWGFFKLEKEVFDKGLEIIPVKTDHYYLLVKQHLKGLMHQAENIALYQYARQTFHRDCDESKCKKSFTYDYSFLKMEDLQRSIDIWSRELVDPNERQYFSGYVHFYAALRTDPNDLTPLLRHLKQAQLYFEQCSDKKSTNYTDLSLDANIVGTYLDSKLTFNMERMVGHFSDLSHLKYNVEGSNTLCRLLLLSSYFGQHFNSIPLKMFQNLFRTYYANATKTMGYRKDILDYLADAIQWNHQTNNPREWSDLPDVNDCFAKEVGNLQTLEMFWKDEELLMLPIFDDKQEARGVKRGMQPSKDDSEACKKPKTDETLPTSSTSPAPPAISLSLDPFVLPTSKDFMLPTEYENHAIYCVGYNAIKQGIIA